MDHYQNPTRRRVIAEWSHGLMRRVLKFRRFLIVALHLFLFPLTNYFAFQLRFGGVIPSAQFQLMIDAFPLLVLVRGVAFVPFRLYEGLWRYTEIWDLGSIAAAVASGSAALFIISHWVIGATDYPRSVIVIDSLLQVSLLATLRLGRRAYKFLGHIERDKRVLIFGAGDAGELIVRDMKNSPHSEYDPIGFIDDDAEKRGQRIHGVPVLGAPSELPFIIPKYNPQEVVIAARKVDPAVMRRLIHDLSPFRIPIKTLPNLGDALSGKVTVSQIRNLSIEDLLSRKPVGSESAAVQNLICGKRVLITGAGGSIGSELARQVAMLKPESLVLFERYENGLYDIINQLEDSETKCLRPMIGDVTDSARVRAAMKQHRPDVVFHAAAHKHVPLMEANPCEAVKNNVTGTRIVSDAASEMGVGRFILISTDKAVQPSSIMGATKRVAELLVLKRGKSTITKFSIVRFGNVLGSNGSVVPRFLAQIKAGGPVTVTHPEMRRYFMLIPEAVHLVLHAATMAEAGCLYVLEMGEQLSVLEMARTLIRLSGFVPEDEIPIAITGLRPGEKLTEQLVADDEILQPSSSEKILKVTPGQEFDWGELTFQIAELEKLAARGDTAAMLKTLAYLVPSLPGIPALNVLNAKG